MTTLKSTMKSSVLVVPLILSACGPGPSAFEGNWSSDGNGQLNWASSTQSFSKQLSSFTYSITSGDTDSQVLISDVLSNGVCNATAQIKGNEATVVATDSCPTTANNVSVQIKYTSGTFRLEGDPTRASWTASGTATFTDSNGDNLAYTFKVHDTLTKNQ